MERIAYLGAWAPVVYALSLGGMAVFYGRFYVQWYVSERAGKSVIPVAFWYMSGVGSVFLFIYGVCARSPVGTLSHCFNMVVYMRNLVHIWREKGVLSRGRSMAAHGVAGVVILTAVGFMGHTWVREYQTEPSSRTWVWLAVGVTGQGLFALRFLVQWAVTEWKRKSVVPVVFWYISIAAALLMASSHAHSGMNGSTRADWRLRFRRISAISG